jgi:hypothetical protein
MCINPQIIRLDLTDVKYTNDVMVFTSLKEACETI